MTLWQKKKMYDTGLYSDYIEKKEKFYIMAYFFVRFKNICYSLWVNTVVHLSNFFMWANNITFKRNTESIKIGTMKFWEKIKRNLGENSLKQISISEYLSYKI